MSWVCVCFSAPCSNARRGGWNRRIRKRVRSCGPAPPAHAGQGKKNDGRPAKALLGLAAGTRGHGPVNPRADEVRFISPVPLCLGFLERATHRARMGAQYLGDASAGALLLVRSHYRGISRLAEAALRVTRSP